RRRRARGRPRGGGASRRCRDGPERGGSRGRRRHGAPATRPVRGRRPPGRARLTAVRSVPVLGPQSPIARIATLFVAALGLATILANLAIPGLPPTLVFGLSALSILGLAWLIGQATERLGEITGPQVGGILNATFGNIAELIIAFFALQEGLI